MTPQCWDSVVATFKAFQTRSKTKSTKAIRLPFNLLAILMLDRKIAVPKAHFLQTRRIWRWLVRDETNALNLLTLVAWEICSANTSQMTLVSAAVARSTLYSVSIVKISIAKFLTKIQGTIVSILKFPTLYLWNYLHQKL